MAVKKLLIHLVHLCHLGQGHQTIRGTYSNMPIQETGGQPIDFRLKLTFKSNMHRVITQKQVSQLIDRVI